MLHTWMALALATGLPGPAGDEWPQLLGPARNGVARLDGPVGEVSERWRVPIGSGLSGPVVVSDRVVIFHRKGGDEIVECLEAANGKQRWSMAYPSTYSDSFGSDDNGPRATPTVDGGRVFALGAEGKLHAIDLESGRKLWAVDFRSELSAPLGYFGFGCSPLVEKDRIVLNVGGENGAGVVALDVSSGKVLWKATDDEASYSSPVSMDTPGGRAIVLFTRSGLRLVDPASGKVRSSFPWRARIAASVNAANPIVAGDQVLLTASYGTGAVLLELKEASAVPVWKSDEAISAHYATPVFHGGHLYGFDGRVDSGTPAFRCVELATGKVKWSRDRFGGGTVLLAGGELVILTDEGELVIAQASTAGWKELRWKKVLDGPVRAYPAIAGGRLYARNSGTLVSLDLKPTPAASK